MSPHCRLLSALIAAVACAAAARAQAPDAPVFRDDNLHYQFKAPAGWSDIPQDLMRQVNEVASSDNPPAHFIGGLRRGGVPGRLEPPYLLIQIRPQDKWVRNYNDVRASLRVVTGGRFIPVREQPLTTLKEAKDNDLFLDMANNRVVAIGGQAAWSEQPKEGAPMGVERKWDPLRKVSVAFLGAKNIVVIHYYDRVNGFETRIDPIDELMRSFRFDEGHEFRPVGGTRYGPSEEKHADAPTAEQKRNENLRFGALLALGLGLLCALFVWRAKVGEVLPRKLPQGGQP